MSKKFVLALASIMAVAACADQGGGGSDHGGVHVQATDPGDPTCYKTTSQQARVGAQATNAVRQKAGLPFVAPDPLLSRVAARHACDMARRGLMTHKGSGTPGPGARVKANGYMPLLTAENIAAGPYSLGRVLVEWNASQGHRDNMLIPQVRDYGIGSAMAADGKTRFWAAVYAAPRP
ncbi:CAP domain-containing protein [Paracoccus homiensis]|uniref:Cysteine-rich secretory protein family protein n=1 Tax=Paracoccus homiensis TaxID=364199 RepID=A0A1H9YPW1_9RHOB|nr:CAP domain-containing protein [Paracoccus homiensis]SES71176.1 Cysteine-rich secretory protein family protein [Paracoccus homiensis]